MLFGTLRKDSLITFTSLYCQTPALNIFFPVGTILAERLLFVPSGGMCLIIGDITTSKYHKPSHLPPPVIFLSYSTKIQCCIAIKTLI